MADSKAGAFAAPAALYRVSQEFEYGVRRESDGFVVVVMSRRQAEYNASRHFDLGGVPVRRAKGTTDWQPYAPETQVDEPVDGEL